MSQPPSPSSNDCFHCPQGDKPCPDTYRPGAWLARPPAKSAPGTPGRLPGAGEIEATVQQTLRKLQKAVTGQADDPASLPDAREQSSFGPGRGA